MTAKALPKATDTVAELLRMIRDEAKKPDPTYIVKVTGPSSAQA